MKTCDSQADGMTLLNRVFIFIDKNHLLILIIPKIRIVKKKIQVKILFITEDD